MLTEICTNIWPEGSLVLLVLVLVVTATYLSCALTEHLQVPYIVLVLVSTLTNLGNFPCTY